MTTVTPSATSAASPDLKRILIVDDSSTMRLIVRRALEESGYQCVEARNAEEAMALFRAEGFNLLTLDVDMPGKDGYTLCAEIRQLEVAQSRRMTPVVFLTSHDTMGDRVKGFDVGATDFISKPVQAAELIARVNRLLRADNRLRGLSALVVEDSRATRNIIAHTLRDYGMHVFEAEDGAQGEAVLRQFGSSLDVVITDHDMPVMNGMELCRRIRTVLGYPWMPVIFLSGMTEMSYVLAMFEAGATDCLSKPFTRDELVARISVHAESQRLHQQHARQIESLEKLNKLKDGLLAIASHDLRAPLTGIMGFSSIMLMDDTLPEEHRENVEGIQNSGQCLLQMISDLLDLARIEAGTDEIELTICDLDEVIAASLSVLRHMAAPKGILLTHFPSGNVGPVRVNGHRNSLLRIINNLVSNAIKFTPKGGEVKILCHRFEDGNADLIVSDTGIGIPAEKIGALFNRFSKATRSGTAGEAGTGLGMSIVKELTDRHGARVSVASEVGHGTQFTVRFPAPTQLQ